MANVVLVGKTFLKPRLSVPHSYSCRPFALLSADRLKPTFPVFVKSGRTFNRQARTRSFAHRVPLSLTSSGSQKARLPFEKGFPLPISADQHHGICDSRYLTTQNSSSIKAREYADLDTTFSNSKEAYRSKTTSQLLRALFVFKVTSYEVLVKNNMKLMRLLRRILGKWGFHLLMKNSFYGQFVAGADVDEIKPVIKRNLQFGVKSILDYSVEEDIPEDKARIKEKQSCESEVSTDSMTKNLATGRFDYHEEFADRRMHVMSARTYFYDSEGQCDKNMWTFMKCVDVVAEATDLTGFAAVKLTALGRPQLLLQMSRVLTHMRDVFDKLTMEQTDVVLKRIHVQTLAANLTHLGIPVSRDDTKKWFTWLDISGSGEIDVFNWSNLLNTDRPLRELFTVPNLKTGKLEQVFPSLSDAEEAQMKNMLRRINQIAEHAQERGVRIMVDAEQTYFQPAISRLTMEMMRRFNKDQAVIFNTYQCYLKQSYENFIIDLDLANRENFCFGAKVVRGAYMDQERARAKAVGYEDPINDSFEATSRMYEKVVERGMMEAKLRDCGKVAVMVASHNEDTIRFVVQKMNDYNIHRADKIICFGQLLGMCDHISFPLGQSGYSVFKYVPYGPVDEVLPYLSRRAQENRGLLAKVQKERNLLWQEVRQRLLYRGTDRGGMI